MSSRERILASIAKEDVDKVPICPPFQGYWALGMAGLPVRESIMKPKMSAQAQIDVIDRCGFDGIETMWDWLSPAEALGCEVKIPELGSIPTMTHIIDDPSALDGLELPDPRADYRMKSSMLTTDILVDRIGDSKFLYMTVVSPFTLVGELRGVEQLMLDTFTEPDFVNSMLDFATETVRIYAERCMTTGVDGVILCDPTASGSLISADAFMEFSQPYMTLCGNAVKDSGGCLLTHICGDTNDRLHDIADIGADVFSVDSLVDLKLAKEQIGDRQTILGNIKPAQTLFSGMPQDSINESIDCIKSFGTRGFILGAGCDVAPETPIQNIEVWKRVTDSFSQLMA